MANYFTDECEATRNLIESCLEGLDESVKANYLVNCLVLKHKRDLTIKEVFTEELKARNEYEAYLKRITKKA